MPHKAPQIGRLLCTLMVRGAAEMRLAAGMPPVLRWDDQDKQLDAKTLEENDLEQYVKQIAPDEVRRACDDQGRCEFGLRFSAEGMRCDIAVIVRKGDDGYEMTFRLLGPVERERGKKGMLSELSEDLN
jgi:Tfp pilus assembly pilus retraction ATPase PilT